MYLDEFASAIELARGSLELDIKDEEAWIFLAVGYRGLGRFQESLDAYTELMNLKGWSDFFNLENMGEVYLLIGDRQSADRIYQKLLTADPDMAHELQDFANNKLPFIKGRWRN